jgi:hypothetical protein
LFALTTALAVATSACSASPARVARVNEAPLRCHGGLIQTAHETKQYAGCTEIEGDLRIEDAAVSDLSELASLRTVRGALVIAQNAELSALTGLEHLSSVDRLEIDDNPALSSLSALHSLQSAPVVRIRNNPELASVHGLEGLQRIETLALVNDAVIETSGLEHLSEVGDLIIANNPKLISLRGLNGVTRARSVSIKNNRLLCARLGLLPALGEVSDTLSLAANQSVSKREAEELRRQVKVTASRGINSGGELALH